MILHIGCKVNLHLALKAVRPDGYHELSTLFVPVAQPHDDLEIEPRDGTGLTLTCSDKALETPSNLAAKAYEAFAQATGSRPGVRAHLIKRIPSGAGLGGGSADAAALLAWLNARAGERALAPKALATLAASIGADVPFFLLDRPAWASGIGERLVPADVDLAGLFILVCVPPQRVNTAWAYRAWDAANGLDRERPGPNPAPALPEGLEAALAAGRVLANDFEPVVYREFPDVRRLKERLLALGAAGACLSGSGSAVFGLFREKAASELAEEALADGGFMVFASALQPPRP
ncbi:4-diphosphocytidyl-2-C-methyl-D-erythritol kinase [Fundidesulfovibrio magnetotacticus]|uniref:4-diphosphocytidyl-2-C-methyl-D-erythritol kinase n=1 Tax=Fundidesulfovibrio magnetotacticus TaxID=2730080 RepID=A0A6V8LXZ6_9BACT|nr:4-(cytidine 5'-diphospho)-2-C-methyl-D-erythritol kinase [Fundidesulfovibrio magnetotacticus]GFK95471.1 4-diphosphocytidyl-2-C-methyl-D-erythritol kinase [Fundidesulfovibrio magnetotacticus]